MTGQRFNIFQNLAREWEAVHPYNAGQAMRIAGDADVAALAASWMDVSEAAGLSDRFGVSAVEEARDIGLERHFTRGLNLPFPEGSRPFRPFIIRQTDSFWMGMIYRHCIADSVAIRSLMRAWFMRLLDPSCELEPLSWPARGYRQFLIGSGRLDPLQTPLMLLRRYSQMRRARKIHTCGPLDYPVRVRLFELVEGLIPRLREYAHRRQVKLTDVFLAALLAAAARLVPAQHRSDRTGVAVGSIVDLRNELSARDRDTFGLFLGFDTVQCAARQAADWPRLAQTVSAQTCRGRKNGRAAASALWMGAAALAGRFTARQRLYDLYRKELPLLAGISNVNLNETWVAERRPRAILEYLRVSPTGPMVPAVLSLTTFGDALRVAMTYRTALINDWTAGELVGMFVRRLRDCAVDNSGVK